MFISQADAVHYLPIATTLIAAAFFIVLVRAHTMRRSGLHLLWWAAGVFAYGLGTALESAITLFGNSVALNKSWYIAGALLGGYPLAQGTVFLLCKPRTAWTLTAVTLPVIAVTATLVLLSPVDVSVMLAHKPGGDILQWSWVRLMTPFINGYAALFLIGGAIYSAARYVLKPAESPEQKTLGRRRAIGNIWIAVGAILPGIGGGMAKAGTVEALYVGEFVGIIFIWIGYSICVSAPVLRKPVVPAIEPDASTAEPARS